MAELSIIVPVFNVESYLKRCMDSILNQTYRDFEIILVDDGSTDSSCEMCDDYSRLHQNVKVIHKANAGLGMARNSGLDIASGDYVSFVDSDDFLELDRYEKMMKAVKENDLDACLEGNSVYKKGRVVSRAKNKKMNNLFVGNEIINELLPSIIGAKNDGSDYVGMSVWRGIYKRSVIEKGRIRFLSEREYMSEDILFDVSFYSLAKRVFVLENFGYYYCINDGSLTKTANEEKYLKNEALFNLLLAKLKDIQAPQSCYRRLQYTYIFNMKACISNLVGSFKPIAEKSKKIGAVRNIVSSDNLQMVLSDFDSKGMPFHKKVFVNLLRKERVRSIVFYVRFQNSFHS